MGRHVTMQTAKGADLSWAVNDYKYNLEMSNWSFWENAQVNVVAFDLVDVLSDLEMRPGLKL